MSYADPNILKSKHGLQKCVGLRPGCSQPHGTQPFGLLNVVVCEYTFHFPMETYLNDNILKASNLKSPQTCTDNVVSDSSPMSPIPTVGQSLLQTVTENETDRLSSGVLGVGHKSFHSAMRATSFHFPENCSLAKKYW